MARGKEKEELSLEEKLEQALVPVEEWPYEVPGNWGWVTIGTIASVKGGKRVPKGKQLVEDKTEHPYIRVTDFDNRTIAIEQLKYIDEETFKLIHNYTISTHDIYISIAGTIGKVGIIPKELDGANLTENAAKITNIKMVDKIFLLWLLESEVAQSQMRDSTISTTQPKLALFRIENVKFPLPPLVEQQRIVDRIERLFDKLDEAKEKVQAVVDGFELRKNAILHKSFTGELTEKWRTKKGINILDWEQRTIKDVCNDIKVGIVIKPTQYYTEPDNGVAAFRSANVGEAYIEDENWIYINRIGQQENKRSEVHTGDVLVVRSGNPGTACVVTEEYDGFNAIDIIIAVPDKLQLDSKYLCYYTNSPEGKGLVRENKRGMVLPHFNVGGYSKLPIKVPSLEEQHEIVRIIEMEMSKEQKAKEIAQLVVDEIDVMKKAILAKAFRGELGTNNPDEESAIELLKAVLMES